MMGPEEGVMQSRAQAMAALLELISEEPLIICNGYPSREACKLRDRDQNFYMIGSMGATAGIGLGLALAQPEKTIIIFDGDGNVLMSLGTLATIGALKPKNLIHVVFDNEVYGSTGNQPTFSRVVGLEKMARAAGYENVERVWEREDIVYEFKAMLGTDGPSFLLVKVNEQLEDADRIALPPADLTRRFKASLT